MGKRFYAAYGSNLCKWQMKARCEDAEVFGTAWIDGYELLFKQSRTGAYLSIEKKEGARVPVGIWLTTAKDERALDIYEGCPTLYYKTEMELDVEDARTGEIKKETCYLYIMHEERELGIPDLDYVLICEQGYEDFKFHKRGLANAVAKALEVDKNGK